MNGHFVHKLYCEHSSLNCAHVGGQYITILNAKSLTFTLMTSNSPVSTSYILLYFTVPNAKHYTQIKDAVYQ